MSERWPFWICFLDWCNKYCTSFVWLLKSSVILNSSLTLFISFCLCLLTISSTISPSPLISLQDKIHLEFKLNHLLTMIFIAKISWAISNIRTRWWRFNIRRQNQAKIIKKSVFLFWLLNRTIWCKHAHRLELHDLKKKLCCTFTS